MRKFKYKYLRYLLKRKLKREVPRWLVLIIDLHIGLNTFVLTYLLLGYLDIGPKLKFHQVVVYQLPIVLASLLIAFLIVKPYRGIIRHTGFKDFGKVFQANILYLAIISVVFWLFLKYKVNPVFYFGKGILIVHFFFNLVAMVFLRILYKDIYARYIVGGRRVQKRVMIYGAGDSGVITYEAIKKDEKNKILVYGFIDDNRKKVGKRINGIKIYPSDMIDKDFIKKNYISEIIISIQLISTARLNEIADRFSHYGVKLKIVPPVSDWLEAGLKTQQIQPLKIEDLLGRKPIVLKNDSVSNEIKGKTIIVTGAAGSIGGEISRQLLRYSFEKLILIDQAESALYDLQQELLQKGCLKCEFVIANIKNYERMRSLMEYYRPDLVFHSAAYKHVPLMEENPYEAVMTNVKGTKNMADLANEFGTEKFVLISTDKAVNPTNVMGATKRIAELYVTYLNAHSNCNYVVTRFGNVLGSNGSVIPIFKKQIKKGGPLTVTHPEITRYFMTIPEACQLVLEAGAMGKGGEVFVFDMGESVKILDLAKKAIRLSGLKYPEDIDIVFTGLRPGEKIYEELLADNENTIKTHHPKIMKAKVSSAIEDLNTHVDSLISDFDDADKNNLRLVAKMKEIVPEYISQNSIYSSIDEARLND